MAVDTRLISNGNTKIATLKCLAIINIANWLQNTVNNYKNIYYGSACVFIMLVYHVIEHLVNCKVARDPNSRMPFVSAGLDIRTIGCSNVC